MSMGLRNRAVKLSGCHMFEDAMTNTQWSELLWKLASCESESVRSFHNFSSNHICSSLLYLLSHSVSISKMPTLMDMPNEILFKIISQLENESWEGYPFNFHSAITTALQNLRLICKWLNPVGASVLFQNTIYDEELYSIDDGFRLTDFALPVSASCISSSASAMEDTALL